MIKIFVDSGSSIKQTEKESYGVEILPLKIRIDDEEYLDGIDLDGEKFYAALKENKNLPKTSLPSLGDAEEEVGKYLSLGYDVLIITISSGISGTYNAMRAVFGGEKRVRVVDSQTAVGGVKILVKEANKYLDNDLDFVVEKLNQLIPKIKVLAVPETLEYLYKSGRLSRAGYVVGSLLKIKPIIELKGTVKVVDKALGAKIAMKRILSALCNCDLNYPIVPSYTKNADRLDELILRTDEKYVSVMIDKDDLDHAIACHWGEGAFGYIFVEKR